MCLCKLQMYFLARLLHVTQSSLCVSLPLQTKFQMKLVAFFACFLAFAASLATGAPLTVHVVAHSHCDAGYRQSFEGESRLTTAAHCYDVSQGYYVTEVKHILTSAVQALLSAEGLRLNRTFIWQEQSFFARCELEFENWSQYVRCVCCRSRFVLSCCCSRAPLSEKSDGGASRMT